MILSEKLEMEVSVAKYQPNCVFRHGRGVKEVGGEGEEEMLREGGGG
jgi:hypothetical protein